MGDLQAICLAREGLCETMLLDFLPKGSESCFFILKSVLGFY